MHATHPNKVTFLILAITFILILHFFSKIISIMLLSQDSRKCPCLLILDLPFLSSINLLTKERSGRALQYYCIFMEGLVQCSANYVPLSPICFLERASVVYANRDSIIYGTVRYTWRDTFQRCINLASALSRLEISPGHVVINLLNISPFFRFVISIFFIIFN